MPAARLLAAATLTTALMTVGTGAAFGPAHAEPATCQGRAATIVGSTSQPVTEGTEGDDVIVAPIVEAGTVQARGGNDLVCLVDGAAATHFRVDTGPGDDSVVNLSSAELALDVTLGAGADSFTGGPADEKVFVGLRDWGPDGSSTDTEVDVVSTGAGDDDVLSGSTVPDAVNADRIDTGDGTDTVQWAGVMPEGHVLQNGSTPDRLVLRGGWRGTEAAIDARERRVRVDGRTVFGWTAVDHFSLDLDQRTTRFLGSAADEELTIWAKIGQRQDPRVVRHIDMGGGDDRVDVPDTARGSLDGGRGDDVFLGATCRDARVDLGASYRCVSQGRSRIVRRPAFEGWESVNVSASRTAEVRGTGGPDRIFVSGARRALVEGGRGADQLSVGNVSARGPVVLRGGRGNDRVVGWAGRQRMYGGPGRDLMRGLRGGDVLVGGPGRDVAYGGQGNDVCSAEQRRTCERR